MSEPAQYDRFRAFLCKTSFEHDAREASDGSRLFPSEEGARLHCACIPQCGLVEVEVRLVRVAQEDDWSDFDRVARSSEQEPAP